MRIHQAKKEKLRGSVCPLPAALVGYTGGADVGRVVGSGESLMQLWKGTIQSTAVSSPVGKKDKIQHKIPMFFLIS